MQRWLGLFVMGLLLAGQSTANLPLAADALPVAPVAKSPDGGQAPVLPGEKCPVESVRVDFGLVHAAPLADRDVWAVVVGSSNSRWAFVSSLHKAEIRLQI
jgi:hypothetical protein